MERSLSDEAKIRKAEEIYNRRKMNGVRVPTNSVNTGSTKRSYYRLKKMGLQIAICIVLYIIIYLVQNTNYIFSDTIIGKTKEILSYDINIQEKFNQVMQFIQQPKETEIQPQTEELNDENQEGEENQEENKEEEPQEKTLAATDQNETSSDSSSTNQMREDANYVKEQYSLSLPLKGTITSHYGLREIAPKFHTGIDIAANTGTKIVSAMDGEVSLVSSEGDYGNHLKIQDGEVVTLYAHCKKIDVKKGDKIKKGQKIAEVGTTGNTTGPHLHFEIIRDGRTIDPEYILEF